MLATTRSSSSLTLVADAARLLATDGPISTRVDGVLKIMRRALGFHDGRVSRVAEGTGRGVREQWVITNGWDEPWVDDVLDAAIAARAPIRRVVRRRGSDVVPDGLITHYCAPIAWDGQLWGAVEVRAAGGSAIGLVEQTSIAALVPLLAVALAGDAGNGSATLVGELTGRQRNWLQSLRETMEAPLALTALLNRLLEWALEATGAEAGSISLVDHQRGELILQAHQGYGRDPLGFDSYGEPRRAWSWDHGIPGRAARTGRPLVVRDVGSLSDFQTANPAVRAELAVPITHEGPALAVLVLDSARSTAFAPREVAVITALCEAAVQPLRRAIAYQESLESSTHLRQVFDNLPIGLALVDKHGRVLRHNGAWLSVWGLGAISGGEPFVLQLDLVERLLQRIPDPLAFTDFCTSGQHTPADVKSLGVRLHAPHQDIHVLSVPTRDSLGQLTGRVWMVSDVTREREADRVKSEFISVVSHELRTPLTSILGYTELLLERQFAPAEQREFVQTVYDEASHLATIVEDLLGVTRLEAGTMRLNQWVVSTRQLINEVMSQIKIQLTNRHRLVVDIPAQIPPVYVDRDKVKQILFNLLTNAVKYSPAGGEVTLSIREPAALPPDHPPGSFLIVKVTDQGMGIPEVDLPHIWERFYRVDNSNTRRIGGTGLGLFIVKGLVELHGGRIWVTSAVGRGSVFTLTLPVATEFVRA